MMQKNTFQEYICLPYCLYFKEGVKEDMACRGAQAVHNLIGTGQLDLRVMPALVKEPALWNKYRSELTAYVCARCSFRLADCDFQAAAPEADSEPCGGVILLAHLQAHNFISLQRLSRVDG
jgi:hypothetical protein